MRSDVQHIKRYQIAKVYRRDQPAIARGRLREFYQCDFDIAGLYDSMIPDAEILSVISEVFDAFEMGITIKLNHRKVLDGVFGVSGVPEDKIRAISSAVDKLDKLPWEDVRREMIGKGLENEVADRVGGYVQRSGGLREMIEYIRSESALGKNESVLDGIADLELLSSYVEALGVIEKVSFDLSLARGLDYYTGLIYEVVPIRSNQSMIQVGSMAAGGRYDGLVGTYTNGRRSLPCAGISFGVDRIFTILDGRRKVKNKKALSSETDVYIMAFGDKDFDGLLLERLRVARRLWDAGIRTEFSLKVKPRQASQFDAAKEVPIAVVLGQDEVAAGQVRVKRLHAGDNKQAEKDLGKVVPIEQLVEEVTRALASTGL